MNTTEARMLISATTQSHLPQRSSERYLLGKAPFHAQVSFAGGNSLKKRQIDDTVTMDASLKQTIPMKRAKWWTTTSHQVPSMGSSTPGYCDIRLPTKSNHPSMMGMKQVPILVSADSLSHGTYLKEFSDTFGRNAPEACSSTLMQVRNRDLDCIFDGPQQMTLMSYLTRRANVARCTAAASWAALQTMAISQARLDQPSRSADPSSKRDPLIGVPVITPAQLYRRTLKAGSTPASSQVKERSEDGTSTVSESSALRSTHVHVSQAASWTTKFEELLLFRRKYGHCNVPNALPENQGLAEWVKRQRYQFKLKSENKKSSISDERVQQLDSIDFVWFSHAAVWDERLQELMAYKGVHGDCNVPSRYLENRQLADWVKRQRKLYRLYRDEKPSSLSKKRIDRLEAIGFEWTR